MKTAPTLKTLIPVLFLAAPMPVTADADWPYPEDIPTVSNTVSAQPAGQAAADLVRFYKVRKASSATISPDGLSIAYSTDITGVPQLWIAPATGGAPQQLTFGGGVNSFAWMPNSMGLIYRADTNGDELSGLTYISKDGTVERPLQSAGAGFTFFGDVSSDGKTVAFSSTARNGNDYDLYLQPISGAEAKRVFDGTFQWRAHAWQPSGDYIIVTETAGSDGENLYLLNAKSERVVPLYQPPQETKFKSFAWTKDGSGFYLVTNLGREYRGLAFYELSTGELRFLETPDMEVDDVALGADDRYVAWLINAGGYSALKERDLETNTSVSLPELPRGIYSIDMAKTAPVLQIRITSPQIPGDVWTYNFESEALSRVTLSSSAGVDLSAMVLPETITFKARDGVDLYGLFYPPRPQEIDEKPPVVLMVHGGPTAQARPQFNTTIQYLLARGYAVFDFNYRGSTGYGRTFVSLDDKRLRPNAILDVEDAMGWLESSGRVDVDKAAIFGGSYGGYMVNAALGSFPDLFAAGVSFVGVSDWVRALEEASPSLKASDRFEYGDITDPDDRAYFAEISPLKNADKIKAPILVQHGANDPRDPVTESDRLVQKVRDAGGTVTYIRLKDEGHSIKKITNRVYVYSQVAAFLDEHLMGVAPKTTPKKLPETSALSPMAVTLAAVQAEAKTRFTDQDLKQKNAALTALLQSRMAAQQALIAAAETLRAQLSTVKASELAAEDAAQAASESVGAVETAKIGLAKRKAEVEAAERKQAAAQEAASQATESLENDMRALVTATLAAEAAEVEVQKIDREISALQEEIGVPMSTSSRSAAEVNSQ